MKTCIKCQVLKGLNEFELSYSKVYPLNRRNNCKKCRNKDKKKLDTRHGAGLRRYNLKKKYNLSIDDYINMSEKQDNKCYLCNKINEFGPWHNKLVVDHCHKTNKIRKLLCDKCNKGLGQFNDDPELLQKAINYLKEHQG